MHEDNISKFQEKHDNFNDINDRMVPKIVCIQTPPTPNESLHKAYNYLEKEKTHGFFIEDDPNQNVIKRYIDKEDRKRQQNLYEAMPILQPKPLPKRAATSFGVKRKNSQNPRLQQRLQAFFAEEDSSIPEQYRVFRDIHQVRSAIEELKRLPFENPVYAQDIQKEFFEQIDKIVDQMNVLGMFGKGASKQYLTHGNRRYFVDEMKRVRKNLIYSNIRNNKIAVEKLPTSIKHEFGLNDVNYYNELKKRERKEEDEIVKEHLTQLVDQLPPTYRLDFSTNNNPNPDTLFSKANKAMIDEIELNLPA